MPRNIEDSSADSSVGDGPADGSTDVARDGCADGPDSEASSERPVPPPELLDLTILHRIEIECAPDYLALLDVNEDQRIPCRVAIDGIGLENVGIRKRGGLSTRRP
ncbi:MAG: hypothetical protein JXR83_17195, partial [Deltaproteobacteria bacterium]|nr:hypothetical protein [Deltaproteobacteria bacterium]